jgi:hypothetical protein
MSFPSRPEATITQFVVLLNHPVITLYKIRTFKEFKAAQSNKRIGFQPEATGLRLLSVNDLYV